MPKVREMTEMETILLRLRKCELTNDRLHERIATLEGIVLDREKNDSIDERTRKIHKLSFAKEEWGTMCEICDELVEKDERIYNLKCGHRFHTHCLAMHLITLDDCPYCLSKIF